VILLIWTCNIQNSHSTSELLVLKVRQQEIHASIWAAGQDQRKMQKVKDRLRSFRFQIRMKILGGGE
jgi:hypothetical protein